MYKLIDRNAEDVIAATQGLGELSRYTDLMARLPSGKLGQDTDFQMAYREYWRMGAAHLPASFYKSYFELLDRCYRTGNSGIQDIVSQLRRAGRGPQFSFATKLAHSVNPRLPIYDSFVAAFYLYKPPASQERGLASLLAFYAFLGQEYARVLAAGLLRKALATFRQMSPAAAAATDERLIDWLIWGHVSLVREGTSGEKLRYE